MSKQDAIKEKLEQMIDETREKMDVMMDNQSQYPCEFNQIDLAEARFQTLCDVIKLLED